MTNQEVQNNGNSKKTAIEVLCQQLQMSLSAEQVITKEGFIKNIVLYTDNEKYDIKEETKQDENNNKDVELIKEQIEKSEL